MRVIMNTRWFCSIEQVQRFLEGSEGLKFEGEHVSEKYKWTQEVLVKFSYYKLPKKDKGIIRQYIQKVTGYKSAQITRLIRQYTQIGYVKRTLYKRYQFPKKYTAGDVSLLAKTDKLHELNGAATKKILERESNHGQSDYNNIANISVSHLYNLRKDTRYKKHNTWFSKTKAVQTPIGERRKPQPNGQPGYIRIDTVHQGDYDGRKGVYHINAVDEVTQFEIVGSVQKISEQFLKPLFEDIFQQFPIKIISFHSDNGSEFINKTVASLLNKLLIQQTKSRARHSNDNALAECKNGAVIRKHMGYAHIPQYFASKVNEFNREYLNPYINYHRPCFFPTEEVDSKGKIKKKYRYEDMMTPYDKLNSLPNAQKYLRDGVSFDSLDAIASEFTDNQFAERMVTARNTLWNSILSGNEVELMGNNGQPNQQGSELRSVGVLWGSHSNTQQEPEAAYQTQLVW